MTTRTTPTGAKPKARSLSDMEEKFCRAMGALGMDQSDAVRFAGWVVKQPHNKGWHLQQRPEIAERIEHYRQQAGEAKHVEAVASTLEPHTREWLLAEHLRNLHISRTREDVKEARATLTEIGKLQGLYVEKTEVTQKIDPVSSLSAQELDLLKKVLSARLTQMSASDTLKSDAKVIDHIGDTAPDA